MKRVGMLFVVLLTSATPSFAEPLSRDQVPDPLRPWIDWVLRGHEEERCPFFAGSTDRRQCSWPARLALELDEKTGRLEQDWFVDRDAWASLPGDASHWPQDVRVDGKPAVVTARDAVPTVRLSKGKHRLTASFAWDELPELLPIPQEIGLVSLVLDGRPVAFPKRDPLGQLWLKARSGGAEESRLEVRVHRRITDEVPLELTTRIELDVSGKSREQVLARALPDGFVPMSLQGPLPARLDPDGRLRVQLRPGTWALELRARHEGPVASLALPTPQGPWASEEVWVFEARPALRLVTVEGAPSIDPQQTRLPGDWRRFPAYAMRPGSTLRLVETRRGDTDPAPDQLTLRRTWWLDFDGGGYTVSDQLSGTLSRGWRLEMPPPMRLGRAAIGGRDQLITRRSDPSVAGVEVREGQFHLEADSRLDGAGAQVPALGWDHDFQQVSAQLNLPPGWRLFYASGIDDVSSTWVTDWTLLDLFLVLITALAAARVWGGRWGVLALATLVLVYLEPDAPRGLWLALLAGEALLSVLPAGRTWRFVRLYRFAVLVGLVVAAIPFMASQVRVAIYPALEMPWIGPSPLGLTGGLGGANAESETAPATREMLLDQARPAPELKSRMMKSLPVPGVWPQSLLGELGRIDEKASISTGPGLPRWHWRAVALGWRGPVEPGQRIHFFLLSPNVNFLLAFLRVGLLAALLLKAVRGAGIVVRLPGASATAAAFVVLCIGSTAHAAEYPPAELLKDLQQRLLEPPECVPGCASSQRLRLDATATALVLRLEIEAVAETAVPIPGGARSWTPAQVLVDGEPAEALAREGDGVLWLRIPAGTHQVVLEGPLPAIEAVDVPLPLRPRRVEAAVTGWTLSGVRDNGVPEDSLRLLRERRAGGEVEPTLEPGEMPPFARLERDVLLGLSWEVESVLTRVTPPGTAFTAAVPLLEGESVTTPNVHTEDGKVLVVLAPGVTQSRWHSVLSQKSAISLAAVPGAAWSEVWRLNASPLWHIELRGIPAIHYAGPRNGIREWHPWPGESIEIKVERPEGFPGQTLTVDHAQLEMSPGLRASDVTLSLEIRSSRGAQHTFTLPEDAELQSVSVNGALQPIRQEKRSLTVPISPGMQTISLAWKSSHGIATRMRSPWFAVGANSVNADTVIHMPADRWTLAVGGGRLGPAVLFWSLLFVVALASVALGRWRSTPLGAVQWFLLGIGLTQSPIWIAVIVAGWLLALGWRFRHGAEVSDNRFNWMQIGLVLWTAASLAGLFAAIQHGLLGSPEMQIAGNGSSAELLRWYHDRAAQELPRTWVISVPLWVYRLAMLAWALWVAWALLAWLRWGWSAFSAGGLWRASARGWRLRRPPTPPAPAV